MFVYMCKLPEEKAEGHQIFLWANLGPEDHRYLFCFSKLATLAN